MDPLHRHGRMSLPSSGSSPSRQILHCFSSAGGGDDDGGGGGGVVGAAGSASGWRSLSMAVVLKVNVEEPTFSDSATRTCIRGTRRHDDVVPCDGHDRTFADATGFTALAFSALSSQQQRCCKGEVCPTHLLGSSWYLVHVRPCQKSKRADIFASSAHSLALEVVGPHIVDQIVEHRSYGATPCGQD